MSRVLASVRKSAARLHEAGAISDLAMREYDALCRPERQKFPPGKSRRPKRAKAKRPG